MLHGIDLSVINPRIGFKLVAGILADNLDGILAKLGFVCATVSVLRCSCKQLHGRSG